MNTFQQYVRRKQRMGMFQIDDKEEIKHMLEIDKELKEKLGIQVKPTIKKDRTPVSYGEGLVKLPEDFDVSAPRGIKKNCVVPDILPIDRLSPEAREMMNAQSAAKKDSLI
mmetsp:Transcript_19957/g.27641  ORF Transcript_19957/g.27641 Transcript_19957/m.27641 type:complete len:111 (+) Transcript_19957:1-333(+)